MNSVANPTVCIEFARIIHETSRAVLLAWDGEDLWVPRSVIDEITAIEPGRGECYVQVWWLDKNNIEY